MMPLWGLVPPLWPVSVVWQVGELPLLLAAVLAHRRTMGAVSAAIRRLLLAGGLAWGRFHRYFLVQGVLDSALALASAVSTTACTL